MSIWKREREKFKHWLDFPTGIHQVLGTHPSSPGVDVYAIEEQEGCRIEVLPWGSVAERNINHCNEETIKQRQSEIKDLSDLVVAIFDVLRRTDHRLRHFVNVAILYAAIKP